MCLTSTNWQWPGCSHHPGAGWVSQESDGADSELRPGSSCYRPSRNIPFITSDQPNKEDPEGSLCFLPKTRNWTACDNLSQDGRREAKFLGHSREPSSLLRMDILGRKGRVCLPCRVKAPPHSRHSREPQEHRHSGSATVLFFHFSKFVRVHHCLSPQLCAEIQLCPLQNLTFLPRALWVFLFA